MLNPSSPNEELGARLREILLRIAFSNVLTRDDMKTLCYATGVQITWDDAASTETRLQRLQRMAMEAEQWRKQQDIQQVNLRG